MTLCVSTELYTTMMLELAPVAPHKAADSDIAVHLHAGQLVAAIDEVQIDQFSVSSRSYIA